MLAKFYFPHMSKKCCKPQASGHKFHHKFAFSMFKLQSDALITILELK